MSKTTSESAFVTWWDKAWSSIINTFQEIAQVIARRYYIGKQWRQVFGSWNPVFPENQTARAMAIFKDWLYLGTEKISGLEIWRSYDGLTWKPCVGSTAIIMSPNFNLSPP